MYRYELPMKKRNATLPNKRLIRENPMTAAVANFVVNDLQVLEPMAAIAKMEADDGFPIIWDSGVPILSPSVRNLT